MSHNRGKLTVNNLAVNGQFTCKDIGDLRSRLGEIPFSATQYRTTGAAVDTTMPDVYGQLLRKPVQFGIAHTWEGTPLYTGGTFATHTTALTAGGELSDVPAAGEAFLLHATVLEDVSQPGTSGTFMGVSVPGDGTAGETFELKEGRLAFLHIRQNAGTPANVDVAVIYEDPEDNKYYKTLFENLDIADVAGAGKPFIIHKDDTTNVPVNVSNGVTLLSMTAI